MDPSAEPQVEQEHPLSGPNSFDEDNDRRSATGSSDRGRQPAGHLVRESESSSESSSGSENSDSEESSSESGEEHESAPRDEEVLNERGGEAGPSSLRRPSDVESFTGGYSFSGTGEYEFEVRPALSVPRRYHRFSTEITELRSIFRSSDDLSGVTAMLIGKTGRRGMWEVEGMAQDEHAAIWPSSLKFVMYDVCITNMHIRPPFSPFQQTVLATLCVAPSQLHPNGWAFMRSFELICRWLSRPVSVALFFNLFEIQRNQGDKKDAPGMTHVSLRSVRKSRVFQLYSDSLKGNNWKSRFYWVKPTDNEAQTRVGRFSEDGTGIAFTQFHLGWSWSHYSADPGRYRTDYEELDDEDRETRAMLFACADALPSANTARRGFHTPSLVHAKTRNDVLAAIRKMTAENDEDFLLQVATGAAKLAVPAEVPPVPLPDQEPIDAPPLTEVREVQAVETRLNLETAAPRHVEILNLDDSDAEGHGKGVAEGRPSGKAPPSKEKKRKHGKGAEASKTAKKHKSNSHRSGTSSRYRSFALDEEFSRRSYEEYVADPLGAAVHTVLHLSDLVKEERTKGDLQIKGTVPHFFFFFLTLSSSEIQAGKDAERRAKEKAEAELKRAKNHLRMLTLTLVMYKQDLQAGESMRQRLSKENSEQRDKISSLEAKQTELLAKEKKLTSDVQNLNLKVNEMEKKLQGKSSATGDSDRIAMLESMLAQSEEKAQRTAQIALKMREKYFNLALDQVMVVNPGMDRFKSVFSPTHAVEEGKVVAVDQASKKKIIIYSPPAQN